MSVYDLVTARILQQLEQGTAPWRKPWGGPMRTPRNLTTLKPYRGINVFLLACQGYDAPFWLTYRQAQELGGHVRQGEKGSPVVFWKEWETTDKESGEPAKIPVLRHYSVFHVSQCEGIGHLVPSVKVVDNPNPPIERCETVVGAMPSAPAIRNDLDSAFYRPSQDMVGMPPRARFDSSESYYATLFHELTHSTGHASRLNRPGIADPARFGSQPYGREELIAEMGAAFLCAHTGIETATLDNSASYIAGWIRAIRQDKTLVVTAAAQAQKAADYVLGAIEGRA
jgi:antirestriction protein ArdC